MAWLAVDEDGTEIIFRDKPLKYNKPSYKGIWHPEDTDHEFYVELPKGTIEQLIGRTLTFNDDAIEL